MDFSDSRRSANKKKNTRRTKSKSTTSRSRSTMRTSPVHENPRGSSRVQKGTSSVAGMQAKTRQPSQQGRLSPERKIDLIGVVIALVGLLTILSIFSFNRSGLTSSWISALELVLGWGVYIFPFGLLILGVWLIARNVESLPRLSLERFVGIILLFLVLLVILHAVAVSLSNAVLTVDSSIGGGLIGGLILQVLNAGFGKIGATFLVIAWFLIAMTMTLDITLPELFKWIAPLFKQVKKLWNERKIRQAEKMKVPVTSIDQAASESVVPENDFTPLRRPPVSRSDSIPPDIIIRTGSPTRPVITWELPSVKDILEVGTTPSTNEEFIRTRAHLIEETLASFGAPSQVVEISRGPTITMFGVEPHFSETRYGRTRVRVSKIASLADDLALALAAPRIRIQAPVPGRSYVGIEVPNEEMSLVTLREVVESEVFSRQRAPLRIALGKDVSGHPMITNLSAMPHLLIAGTTGSGKSVCVNAILTCLLLYNTPDDLRLILVDPKRVELTGYNSIPHLLSPVVVEMERVVGALQWMMREMDTRYHKFAQIGARNIQDYNQRMKTQNGKPIPYLVVVVDELADLMMTAPDETERTITRISQLARATGIHLIIATQRPSTDVVTGLIKANFPARIAFAVASGVDSRVILDQPGAERLLGRGDMLFQAPDAPAPVRLQGVFVSDSEIQKLVNYWHQQAEQSNIYAVPVGGEIPGGAAASARSGDPLAGTDILSANVSLKQVPMFEDMTPEEKNDPFLDEAVDLVRREGRASVSMLQRRLRIGYTRAARLIDVMQDKGIIGPQEGGIGVRQVLDYGPTAPPKDE